ncbi:MAG: hypothetical protein H7259_00770 [Cytophagales bacterium]|nr:hypothetical protein [Cytophaga sp.]
MYLFTFSGALAMVIMGLFIGNYKQTSAMINNTLEYIHKFWELLDVILNAILFIIIAFVLVVIEFKMSYIIIGGIIVWGGPESLVKHISKDNIVEYEAELLTYAADEVYEQKTDKDDFYEILKYTQMPVIIFDWKEGDDSLKNKFPTLFKKCLALQA